MNMTAFNGLGPMIADFDQTLVHRNLVELFEEHAARLPDKIAVIGSQSSLTYRQLAERAVRVSEYLLANGLRPEQPVGFFMQRDPDVIVVVLAILRAGGVYVPLDPAEPVERARYLAERAGLSIVLGDASLLCELEGAINAAPEHTPVLDLVDVAPIIDADTTCAVSPCAPGGSRLAYILFTSGSTGVPKGVEVEHRNVINLLLSARQAIGFTEDDRYLATSTLAFDISVAEVFLPLITGASLVLGDRQTLLTRGAVAAMIVKNDVTVFQTGPSVWALLLENSTSFPPLRVAITTGEAIAPSLARRVANVADRVWNLYGPTETTIWCSGQQINTPTGLDESTPVAAPVGYMWPNMPAIVVDGLGRPVPDGKKGELWVGDLAVTRGYQNNPALTAQRYVTRVEDGIRYYRTGDIVSREPDGLLKFFGRDDDQIQVHGVRVEPMEVEDAVRRDPFVRNAAATWFETPSGTKAIVAGVMVKDGLATSAAELHARLATSLPSAMIPFRFVFYETLPMTPNGKTDRIAIRADATAEPSGPIASVDETLTTTERALLAIWKTTLRLPTISKSDNFFAIGGDSLAAVTMMIDAEDVFDISLPMQAALETSTLEALAARIDRMKSPTPEHKIGTNTTYIFPLVREGKGSPVFFAALELNFARNNLWKLDCPLYAMNYWTLGNGFSKSRSVEDLARQFVSDIRDIQPIGPYRVGGFSFGGILASEIAHQLRSAGDEVELLFLLDPTQPYRTPDAPELSRIDEVEESFKIARAARQPGVSRVARHLGRAVRRPTVALPLIGSRTRSAVVAWFTNSRIWPRVQFHLVDLHGRYPKVVAAKRMPKDRGIAFWFASRRVGRDYVAKPYDGPALAIFLHEGGRFQAWRKLLGQSAEIRIMDTTHYGLVVDPALTEWMTMLDDRIA